MDLTVIMRAAANIAGIMIRGTEKWEIKAQ
jgi:hypothetical protein